MTFATRARTLLDIFEIMLMDTTGCYWVRLYAFGGLVLEFDLQCSHCVMYRSATHCMYHGTQVATRDLRINV